MRDLTGQRRIHRLECGPDGVRTSLGECPVFGKIKFMSADGYKRKFDVAGYCSQWS